MEPDEILFHRKTAQYEIKDPKDNTRRGSHFVKWNIILAKGKEYKNDFESSGEQNWNKPASLIKKGEVS